MTYEEAMKYRELYKAAADVKEQMRFFSGNSFDTADLPVTKNKKAGLSAAMRRVAKAEYDLLNEELESYTAQMNEIEKWISKVPDRVMQTYMYLRFVDGLTWKQIGTRMNCRGVTARVSVQRYMAKEERRNAGEHENDAD